MFKNIHHIFIKALEQKSVQRNLSNMDSNVDKVRLGKKMKLFYIALFRMVSANNSYATGILLL